MTQLQKPPSAKMVPASWRKTIALGLMYMSFSSTMMVFNKAALRVFPYPMQLTSMQYLIRCPAPALHTHPSLAHTPQLLAAAPLPQPMHH